MIRTLSIYFISDNYAHCSFMAMMIIVLIMTLLFLPQWPLISPYLPPQPDSSPGVTLRQIEIFNRIFDTGILSRLVSLFCLFLTSTLSTQIPHGLHVYLFVALFYFGNCIFFIHLFVAFVCFTPQLSQRRCPRGCRKQ